MRKRSKPKFSPKLQSSSLDDIKKFVRKDALNTPVISNYNTLPTSYQNGGETDPLSGNSKSFYNRNLSASPYASSTYAAEQAENIKAIGREQEVENFARQVIKKDKGFNVHTQEGRDDLTNPLAYAPFSGEALDLMSVGHHLRKGNYGDAAMYGAGLALPIVPGAFVKKVAGPAVNKVKSLFKSSKIPKNFKSEIDWRQWNKEIPDNKDLMEEYRTLEALSKKDGTWMKTPNGNAFSGTPEQFVQQQSKNWKKAFSNTKATGAFPEVYNEGRPVGFGGGEESPILMHQTNEVFDEFDLNKFGKTDHGFYGKGVYLSNPDFARQKDVKRALEEIELQSGIEINPKLTAASNTTYGDINMPLYAKIDNPVPYGTNRDEQMLGKITGWEGSGKDFIEERIKNKRIFKKRRYGIDDYDPLKDEEIQELIQEFGDVEDLGALWKGKYDGNIVPLDFRHTEFIANPQNIKSAVRNNGMFDMTNPNIYKKYGGLISNYKDGGETDPPVKYISDPEDFKARQEAYSDSLNLYKAYQFQKANQLPFKEGADPIELESLRQFYENVKGKTLEEGLEGRKNNITRDIDRYKWDYNRATEHTEFSSKEELLKEFPHDPSIEKIYNYYESLPFYDKINIGNTSSPDLYHRSIKPVDSYWDGSHVSPVYKKPTQPVTQVTTMAKPVMGYEERPQWSKDRAEWDRMNQYEKPSKPSGRLFTAHENMAKEGRETRTYNPGDNTGERKVFSPQYQNGGSIPKYQNGFPESTDEYGNTGVKTKLVSGTNQDTGKAYTAHAPLYSLPEVTVSDKLDRTNPTAVKNWSEKHDPIAHAVRKGTDEAAEYINSVAEFLPGYGEVRDLAHLGNSIYTGDNVGTGIGLAALAIPGISPSVLKKFRSRFSRNKTDAELTDRIESEVERNFGHHDDPYRAWSDDTKSTFELEELNGEQLIGETWEAAEDSNLDQVAADVWEKGRRAELEKQGNILNKSGIKQTELESLIEPKHLPRAKSMQNFENTLLHPDGKLIRPPSNKIIETSPIKMSDRHYVEEFNRNTDYLNDIIKSNNKSGIDYNIENLGYYDNLITNSNIGGQHVGVNLKPGQWKGRVMDIPSLNYQNSIPGMQLTDISDGVFGDGVARRGTGLYKSMNQYLKEFDLGRLSSGRSGQTDSSLGLWKNAVKNKNASGFYETPHSISGIMYQNGGPIPRYQTEGEVKYISDPEEFKVREQAYNDSLTAYLESVDAFESLGPLEIPMSSGTIPRFEDIPRHASTNPHRRHPEIYIPGQTTYDVNTGDEAKTEGYSRHFPSGNVIAPQISLSGGASGPTPGSGASMGYDFYPKPKQPVAFRKKPAFSPNRIYPRWANDLAGYFRGGPDLKGAELATVDAELQPIQSNWRPKSVGYTSNTAAGYPMIQRGGGTGRVSKGAYWVPGKGYKYTND